MYKSSRSRLRERRRIISFMKKKEKQKIKDYAAEIDSWLSAYEQFRPFRKNHPMDKVANRIAWCWKFRKITREEMEDFCNRATAIFEDKNSAWNYDGGI